MTERAQSKRYWIWNCLVCGERFESRPGESFMEFTERVFDEHTEKHIKDGVPPPRSCEEALSNLLDLASRGVLEP